MPWEPKDATRHTKKASSAAQKSKWAKIANAVLKKTGNEASAIRIANSAIKEGMKELGRKPCCR